jgi:hypothetical protein
MFLQRILKKGHNATSSSPQLAVGLLVWTDGWNTSNGCKFNRSHMHTGTVTLFIVEVWSGDIVGIATYPNMGGPGKINHGPAFCRFQEDMADFEKEDSDRVLPSHHHSCNIKVYTKVMFVVQDQPERRGASGLLGGGSGLHPLFGMSCDFGRLELPFEACKECINHLEQYLEAKDWTREPLEGKCQHCLGRSLNCLILSSYVSSFKYPHFAGMIYPALPSFMDLVAFPPAC